MKRAYYSNSVKNFLLQDKSYILGELARNNQYVLEDLQRNSWMEEINILKLELKGLEQGYVLFEYTIPRMGKRIDTLLIYNGLIFLIEFKVGEKGYPKHAINQVMDYALDLKYFHKESHNKILIPMLISTRAATRENILLKSEDGIYNVLLCNKSNISSNIKNMEQYTREHIIDVEEWIKSSYMPTPTIIEAAQALYRGHSVEEISRSDAGAINLNSTTDTINRIIDESKRLCRKSIFF